MDHDGSSVPLHRRKRQSFSLRGNFGALSRLLVPGAGSCLYGVAGGVAAVSKGRMRIKHGQLVFYRARDLLARGALDSIRQFGLLFLRVLWKSVSALPFFDVPPNLSNAVARLRSIATGPYAGPVVGWSGRKLRRRPSSRGARGSNSRLRWPPSRTVPRYAVPMPKTALSATLIEIFFGWCSGFFGIWRVSTPSFKSALTCSPTIPSGSVKARVKFPNVRS